MPEIRFYCLHCGHKLAVDMRGAGKLVHCPKCDYELTVPGSPFPGALPRNLSDADKTHVVRINHDQISTRSHVNLMAVGWAPTTTTQVAGWLFLVLGVAIHVLAPSLGWFYIPFYVLAVAFGVTVMVQGLMTHGAVILGGGIIIPLVVYMFHMQIEAERAGSSHARAPVQTARKLVFDENSGEALVEVDVASPAKRSEKDSLQQTRRIEPSQDYTPIPVDTESRPAAAARPQARIKRIAPVENKSPREAPKTAEDPYADLLANREELPALVPEEVSTNMFGDPALTIEGAGDIRSSTTDYGTGWQVQSVDTSFVWQTPPAPEPVEEELAALPKISFPFILYSDYGKQAVFYTPSGMLGARETTVHEENCMLDPHKGSTCIMASFTDTRTPGGVAWQAPADNWGAVPGGYNLTGAKKVTFWAKKDEQVSEAYITFGVGLESKERYADTACVSTDKLRLTSKWKKYTIPLEGLDLSRIITAFVWRVDTQDTPVAFYLDDIVFE